MSEEIKEVPTLNSDQEGYDTRYFEHLLTQYHHYIDSVRYVGELKQKVNSYFLTINTIFLAAIGISFTRSDQILNFAVNGDGWKHVIPAVGIVTSIIWWAITYSYKQRNRIKLRIIRDMEKELPAKPYTAEKYYIHEFYPGIRYVLFRMSLVTPWIFLLLYVMLLTIDL